MPEITTDLEDQETQVRRWFRQRWEDQEPNVPIAWDNSPFPPPQVANPPNPPTGHWVKFEWRLASAAQKTIGQPRDALHEYRGNVFIKCFAPPHVGVGELNRIKQVANDLFLGAGREFCGLTFLTPSTRHVPDPDLRWFQIMVVVPFFATVHQV